MKIVIAASHFQMTKLPLQELCGHLQALAQCLPSLVILQISPLKSMKLYHLVICLPESQVKPFSLLLVPLA